MFPNRNWNFEIEELEPERHFWQSILQLFVSYVVLSDSNYNIWSD